MTQRAINKSRFWLIIASLIAFGLIITPALIDQGIKATQQLLQRPTSFNESLEFTDPNAFSFDVSQIAVDGRGASLISPNSQSDIILLDRIDIPADTRIVNFSESSSAENGASIRYQLTTDFDNWYYFDGTDWTKSPFNCGIDCTNSVEEINENISNLPILSTSIQVRAYLTSTRGVIPILNSINIQMLGTKEALTPQQQSLQTTLQIAQANNCPLDQQSGRKIVYLGKSLLRSDKSESAAQAGPFNLRLDPGTYKVTLVSQDDHSSNGGQGQSEEKFRLILLDNKGEEITVTGSIDDLPDDVNELIQVVDDQLIVSKKVRSVLVIHDSFPSNNPNSVYSVCAAFDEVEDEDKFGDWDKSSIEVTGLCEAPNAVFEIKNTGEFGNGDMDGPSEYRVYRNGSLEETQQFQLKGGETLEVVVLANGDTIRLEADQRPDHPGNSHPNAVVENCQGTTPQACAEINLNFANLPHGTVLGNQFASQGIGLSAIANAGRPNALIVFDSNQTGTPDPDLQVGIGNIAIIPENVNDSNNNGLVDNPNDSAHGGTQIYRFDHDRIVNSFVFVDKDGGQPGTATAYDGDNNILATVQIPNAGDGSVQTISMNGVGGVRKLEITYGDSGGVTNLNLECGGIQNEPPAAEDDNAQTNLNTPVDIDVLSNDSDPDGSLVTSTVSITTPPTNGTISNIDTGTGIVTYQPNSGFFGTDQFEYEVCDNDGLCDTATVTVLVLAPPVAMDDVSSTAFQTPVDIDVLINDTDPDSPPRDGLNPTTIEIIDNPDNGTITNIDTGTGLITYEPNPGFSGIDFFEYKICDGDGLCDTATVAVSVDEPILDPPIAEDDFKTTPYETPVNIDVLVNDSDPDGFLAANTVQVVLNPTNGIITSINPTTGVITYEPNPGFSGIDTFDYEVCDNDGLCDTATVTITVEEKILVPPVAEDDSSITDQNTAIDIDVLDNDFDPDGVLIPNTVFILTNPLNGTITNINLSTGVVSYQPNNGYSGLDTFSYQVCDNDGLCDDALVTISILPPQLIPPVANDDTETTDQNTPVTVDVLINDSDADGTLVPSTVTITNNPANGTITGINSSTGEIEYTPNTNFIGTDTFEYQVCDNDGLCDTAVVTINIQPGVTIIAHKIVCTDEADLPNWGNGGPNITNSTASEFIADHENCQFTSDWNFQWGQEGVANPGDNTDATGSPWNTFGPTDLNGVTEINIPASQVGARVWIREVWQEGYIEFTGIGTTEDVSAEMYCHQDVLNYDNFDFINNLELGQTYYCVAFNVGEIELLPPVAEDDSTTTPYETPVDIDILVNDFDPDGTLVPSTVTITTNPTNGTITNINTSTGIVSYQPNNGFSGIDTFTYQVCDNDGLCDDALVTVVVEPRELIPPVAENDSATTDQEIPVEIDVLVNDSDPDGVLVPGTVNITSNPINGTITNIDGLTGVITYQPNSGFTGIDTFNYQVCDNDGLCDTATVTITILEGITINAHKIVCEQEVDLPNWGDGGPDINQATASDFISTHENCSFVEDWSFQLGFEGASNPGDNTAEATELTTFGPTNQFGLAQISLSASEVTNRLWLREVWQDGFIEFTGVNQTEDVSAEFYCHDDVLNYDNWDFINNVQLGETYYCVAFNVGEVPPEPPVANDDSENTDENTPVNIDILFNDFDVDGVLVPPPTIISSPANGTITAINPTTGIITYAPNSGFTGVDQFEYEICDNDGLCDTALVTVTIEPVIVLIPPIATDDFETTDLNTSVTINILINDNDPDGSLIPSTVSITSLPINGTIDNINTITGEITYTPNLNFFGVDTFEYIVCDNDGLCDTAVVTITIAEPEPIPPVANDDAAITDQEIPVDIDILVNDTDSDGFIIPSTVTVTVPPSNGTITSIDTGTGIVTYLPSPGFSGLDSFTYQVCDNDGLCDTAVVTIAINELSPPVANDDTATTLVDTPIDIPVPDNDLDIDGTLDFTSITIVTPPVNGSIVSISTLTGGITYIPDSGFTGIDTFEYEICDNDGLCDTALVTITITTPPPPPTPEPPLVVPPAAPAATVVVPTPTVPAPTPTPASALIFGANQFVLAAQSQPLSQDGVIQASIGEPQTFYLEAVGATFANLVNLNTNEVIPMTYNPELKLWATTFIFDQTGVFEFEAQIGNAVEDYSRQINTVVVSSLSTISDQQTGQPVTALITIFEQDPDTGNFEVWNGEAFAQQNPFQADGQYSLILPRGEFYLRIDAPGYNSVTSLITNVTDQSIVSADIELIPTGNFIAQLASLFSTNNQSSNFSLSLTSLPEFNLLPLGQVVPNIAVRTSDSAEFDLFNELQTNQPVVIMVYSKWNTLAQEQVDIFRSVASRLDENIQFIPLTTMEPDNLNLIYLLRGEYDLEMYKPNTQFFDDYFITSLPEFFFLNEDRELVERIVGPQSEPSLENQINRVFSQ